MSQSTFLKRSACIHCDRLRRSRRGDAGRRRSDRLGELERRRHEPDVHGFGARDVRRSSASPRAIPVSCRASCRAIRATRRFRPSAAARCRTRPATADGIVQIFGGANTGTHTITFSQAVLNPVLAIWSLGQPGLLAQFVFGQSFTIQSGGPNAEYGGADDHRGGQYGLRERRQRRDPVQRQLDVDHAGPTRSLEDWYGFTVGVPVVSPSPSRKPMRCCSPVWRCSAPAPGVESPAEARPRAAGERAAPRAWECAPPPSADAGHAPLRPRRRRADAGLGGHASATSLRKRTTAASIASGSIGATGRARSRAPAP